MCTCWRNLQDVERAVEEDYEVYCYLTLCHHGEVMVPVIVERIYDEEEEVMLTYVNG